MFQVKTSPVIVMPTQARLAENQQIYRHHHVILHDLVAHSSLCRIAVAMHSLQLRLDHEVMEPLEKGSTTCHVKRHVVSRIGENHG